MPKNNSNESSIMKNSTLSHDRNQLLASLVSPPAVPRSDPDCQWFPALDVTETEEHYVFEADLPGLQADDLHVTVEENVLCISGERPLVRHQGKTVRVERPTGMFVRRLALPDDANIAEMETAFHDGVLELRIPRNPQERGGQSK